MPKPHAITELLDATEMAKLEAWLDEKYRSVDQVHEWLQAEGFVVSRSSVHRWLEARDHRLMQERMSSSGKLAQEFIAAAKAGSGALHIPDAAVMQVASLIFESAGRASAEGEIGTKDLANLALALQRATLAKVRIEDVRAEMQSTQRKALEEGSKVAQSGGSAEAVVDRVRAILGISEGGGK
jgi:hypothetical protein